MFLMDINIMNQHYQKQKRYFNEYAKTKNAITTNTIADKCEWDQIIETIGENITGKNILDVGCGAGRIAVKFMIEGAHVTGIDLSENLIELANKNTLKVDKGSFNGKCENLLDMDEDHKYEYILFVNVLHHTQDLSKILAKAKRLLAINGKILVIENNPLNPLFIIFFIMIGQLRSHLTFNYLKSNIFSLRKLFLKENFSVIKINKYGYLPQSTYNINSIFISLNRILNKIPLVNLFSAFHYILLKSDK